jgi:hypothetical protein
MPPYDSWNKIDEDEDEELQDTPVRLLITGFRTGFTAPIIVSRWQERRDFILYRLL